MEEKTSFIKFIGISLSIYASIKIINIITSRPPRSLKQMIDIPSKVIKDTKKDFKRLVKGSEEARRKMAEIRKKKKK